MFPLMAARVAARTLVEGNVCAKWELTFCCRDTLAYAYDDWSISVMAKGLNKTDDFRTFSERGQNYRTQFNPNVRLRNVMFGHSEFDRQLGSLPDWERWIYVSERW